MEYDAVLMDWDGFINNIILLTISLVAGNGIFIQGVHLKVKTRVYIIALSVKVVLFNVGLNLILRNYYAGIPLFEWTSLILVILSAVGLTTFIYLITEESFLKVMMVNTISSYIGMFCAFFPMSVANIIKGRWAGGRYVIIIGLGVLLMLIFNVGCRRWIIKLRSHQIKYKLFWIIFIFCDAAIQILGTMGASPVTGEFIKTPIQITVFTGVTIVIGYLLYQRYRKKKLYLMNHNLRLQQNLMNEHYIAMQNQIVFTKKVRHDIANHIEMITEYIQQNGDDEKIHAYVENLKEEYKKLCKVQYSDNVLADAILYNMLERCEKNQIKATVSTGAFECGKMPDVDLISILYQMFDDTIEICKETLPQETRWLEFESQNIAGHLLLRIRGSITEELSKKLLKNRKKNKKGTLTGDLQELVSKYNGFIKRETKDGFVELTVNLEVNYGLEMS